jgi:hypothetical protein
MWNRSENWKIWLQVVLILPSGCGDGKFDKYPKIIGLYNIMLAFLHVAKGDSFQ